jgi:hypothetical protein
MNGKQSKSADKFTYSNGSSHSSSRGYTNKDTFLGSHVARSLQGGFGIDLDDLIDAVHVAVFYKDGSS